MIKIPLKIKEGHRLLAVLSDEDREKLKAFGANQIVSANLKGYKRPRSVEQNAWVHVMFKTVADNVNDPEWDTPEKVKRRVKLAIGFYDKRFVVDGKVYFELRSFAFDKMDQNEADVCYNEIKDICALKLGVEPEVLEPRSEGKIF